MVQNMIKLGWKNIARNKKRSLFTIIAISVGITMLVFASSYIEGIMNSTSEVARNMRTGHVKIMTSEYARLERIMPKEELILNSVELENKIGRMEGVELVSPMVKFNALISKGEKNEPALVVGGKPDALNSHMDIREMVISGNYFGNEGKEILVGRIFAEEMGVQAGDELLLVTTDINYSTYALAFTVTGIFNTGFTYMDKHLLFIPLSLGRDILDCGDSSHEILVYLDDLDRSADTAAGIRDVLGSGDFGPSPIALTWEEDEIIGELMPMAGKIWQTILGIILLIVALVILNTMLMIVMERYQEIGVLKAMGLRNREVFFMIVTESLFIGAIGSFIGVVLGGGLSLWVERTGINFGEMVGKEMWEKFDMPMVLFGNIIYPDLTVDMLVKSFIFGLLIAVIAVLYPAYKSSKMLPAEAFRSILKV